MEHLHFPLDNRNKAKQIQSFVNERLPCLIHLALYKTRATVICLYRYILNKFSCLLQNLRMIFFLVSHFKGTINKVENDEMCCIFLWKNRKHLYFERIRKLTVQNEQLIYTICAIFLGWGI